MEIISELAISLDSATGCFLNVSGMECFVSMSSKINECCRSTFRAVYNWAVSHERSMTFYPCDIYGMNLLVRRSQPSQMKCLKWTLHSGYTSRLWVDVDGARTALWHKRADYLSYHHPQNLQWGKKMENAWLQQHGAPPYTTRQTAVFPQDSSGTN